MVSIQTQVPWRVERCFRLRTPEVLSLLSEGFCWEMSTRALAIARPGKKGGRHLEAHTDIWDGQRWLWIMLTHSAMKCSGSDWLASSVNGTHEMNKKLTDHNTGQPNQSFRKVAVSCGHCSSFLCLNIVCSGWTGNFQGYYFVFCFHKQNSLDMSFKRRLEHWTLMQGYHLRWLQSAGQWLPTVTYHGAANGYPDSFVSWKPSIQHQFIFLPP